jgi:hypothetical protein
VRRTLCGGSGNVFGWFTQTDFLKLEKSGQFPDELVRIKGV